MKAHAALILSLFVVLLAVAAGGSAVQLPRSELFTFHSDVFINFHHFLYRWAQAGLGADTSNLDRRIRVRPQDLEVYEQMDATQRRRWDVPVAYYRANMIDRDLLFDDEMVALRDCLVMAGNFCDRIAARDLDTLEVLNENMGLYRMFFWDVHTQANRAWIAEMIPRALRFEGEIAPRMAAAYTGAWPESRTRVDVAIYANRAGGYTTSDGHITVSSIEPGNQGYLGLELLFHEASHGDTVERPLRRLIRNSFDAIGAETPRDLWHMTIFYTSGHLTRQVLAEAGIDYPQIYAEFAGIFERREDNIRAKAALDAHWKAALEAGEGFEEAMVGVARALGAVGGREPRKRDSAAVSAAIRVTVAENVLRLGALALGLGEPQSRQHAQQPHHHPQHAVVLAAELDAEQTGGVLHHAAEREHAHRREHRGEGEQQPAEGADQESHVRARWGDRVSALFIR